MKKLYASILLSFVTYASAEAQILKIFEKGKIKKDVTIKPNNQNKDKKKDDFEEFDSIEEFPQKVRINDQFAPTKIEVPSVSNKDTTAKLKENKPLPVEVEEVLYVGDPNKPVPANEDDEDDEDNANVNEDWVKIAGYYGIWDPNQIDPYGIEAKEFDEVVDLHLFDPSKNQFWSMPLEANKQTSPFGPRWGRMHSGVDLDLETGTPIYSAFDGMVRVVGYNGGGYGRFVLVRHYNGLETLYGHMSRNDIVVSGQLVKAGDLIGLGGNTGRSYGSHLHFETRYEGNPFNPVLIFDYPNNQIKGEHFLLTPEVFRSNYSNLSNFYGSAGEKVRVKTRQWYRVRSGDTLAEIAARAGISVAKLAKKNRMSSRSTIRPGMRLRIK